MILTLGIDLSTSPRRTYLCSIKWTRNKGEVTTLDCLAELSRGVGASDAVALAHAIKVHDATGIDAPFGWPVAFVKAVSKWDKGQKWPGVEDRRDLRMRRTDCFVKDKLGWAPLSVSSDRLGATAMHCAHVLETTRDLLHWKSIDKTGKRTRVFEVYPGASLAAWSQESQDLRLAKTGYKSGDNAKKRRTELVDTISKRSSVKVDKKQREAMIANDDALDAFICSITARLADNGLCHKPTGEDVRLARTEGWIHFPDGALSEVA